MNAVLTLAPRLLAARRAAGGWPLDALAVAAFAVCTALLETVVGGFHLFWSRQESPPPALARLLAAEHSQGLLGVWVALAGWASVLLVVPLLALSGSAARMGALGRDRRLAALRLLGATPSEVVGLTAAETAVQAAVGALLGTGAYLVTVPAWAPLTFQGTPTGPLGLLLPWPWLAGLVAGIVVLAAAAGAAGLRGVRISPLGVVRASGRRRVRWGRAVALAAVLLAWGVVGSVVLRQPGMAFLVLACATALALYLGVINLVGPLLLQALAWLMARSNRLATRLAGYRLLDDPRGAWRSVSGLAFVGFVAGVLLIAPDLSGESAGSPASALLLADLATGTTLTLAIAFAVAAASVTLNQVASVFDRRGQLVRLDHAGAPRSLFGRVRTAEVLAPAALAALGSAGLAGTFFAPLGLAAGASGLQALRLAATLAGGLALVWAASAACRPALASVLRVGEARVE